jgi:murein DD-endopeptidase MepM/ murein hydrolase activator NlpD
LSQGRISSPYGIRKHPILGYRIKHYGVDYAAPIGTPIYAASDGVIQKAEKNGNYGNYVRIKHNGVYSTAYGHISRFAKGIKSGINVKKGQVIAYVGNTGRSTGPHLHFELIKNNIRINPTTKAVSAVKQLAAADMVKFSKVKNELVEKYKQIAYENSQKDENNIVADLDLSSTPKTKNN